MTLTSAAGAGESAPPPARRSPATRILIGPIRFYQRHISPALPPTCRYYPTCSAYAVEAIGEHGAAKGFYLAVRRLLRCHPWHKGGYDPVPLVVRLRHTRRERKTAVQSSPSSSSSPVGITHQDQRPNAAGPAIIGSTAA
jgi:putative membrane protein insertion efficiency factor